jgi:hypothetical protein
MINGRYTKQPDFSKFGTDLEHLFRHRYFKFRHHFYNTCGSGLLSLLTNKSPTPIEKQLPKSAKHWSGLSLTNYLKKRKFNVIQLSKFGITSISSSYGAEDVIPINENHVLIASCLCCKEEASWFLIHKNIIYHHLVSYKQLNPLFFINKPTQEVWLVKHPSWKKV